MDSQRVASALVAILLGVVGWHYSRLVDSVDAMDQRIQNQEKQIERLIVIQEEQQKSNEALEGILKHLAATPTPRSGG